MSRKQSGFVLKCQDKWEANVGTWVSGVLVQLPDARDFDDAIEQAHDAIQDDDQESYVVQLYKNGEVVWDFLNWHYSYVCSEEDEKKFFLLQVG